MKEQDELTQRLSSQALLACMALLFWYLMTSCSPIAPGSVETRGSQTPSPSATETGTTMEPVISPTPRPSCTVTGYLNFRTLPSRRGAVIRVLEAGERVTVIERGAWMKVQSGSKTGYVYSRYCR